MCRQAARGWRRAEALREELRETLEAAMDMKSAIVVWRGLILAAFLHGGMYQMVIAGSGGGGEGIAGDVRAYRVNRFTGEIDHCAAFRCRPVTWEPQLRPRGA